MKEYALSFFKKLHAKENTFGRISIEKQYATNFLKTQNSSQNSLEISLLSQEVQEWSNISNVFTRFLKRGMFMGRLSGVILIGQMAKKVDAVIVQEQKIIAVE